VVALGETRQLLRPVAECVFPVAELAEGSVRVGVREVGDVGDRFATPATLERCYGYLWQFGWTQVSVTLRSGRRTLGGDQPGRDARIRG
jgi:hypothetical protein